MTSKGLDQLEPEKTQPEGPTEAAQDSPYLLILEDYLAEITFGVTKEITASSQEPDQTSRRSRTTFRRPTRNYQGVTKELPWRITLYHNLPYLAVTTIFTTPFYRLNIFSPPYYHHHLNVSPLAISITTHYHSSRHLTYLNHPTSFTKEKIHLFNNPQRLQYRPSSHFPYFVSSTSIHDFSSPTSISPTAPYSHQGSKISNGYIFNCLIFFPFDCCFCFSI